ncbi:MAG TPA: fumarylacetoacetate hydrolase, partial [Chitinophagaceae bacterium]|nr:fumarylacetoacetate hydrolase [Chitinophagaceae bacterium]
MKLVSYLTAQGNDQLAFYHEGYLYNTDTVHPDLPGSMGLFLHYWSDVITTAQEVNAAIVAGKITTASGLPLANAKLLSPVPFPTSCRDGYAFRQHVAAARRNRGVPMIPEFDQYPIFYFTNHNSIQGPGPIRCMPDHFEKLDFELEAAIVVCKNG